MPVILLEIQMVRTWLDATRQSIRAEPDKGQIELFVMGIVWFVGAVIILGFLVGKAKSAANNVKAP
jgi:ABC-type cobalt transport system substrate-binding protein